MSNLWQSIDGDPATGIILAGGKSSRMAMDKAILTVRTRPVITEVMDILSSVVRDILIVTNQPETFVDFHLRTVRDLIAGKGPLGGLYTGLSVSRTDLNFVVACDMPFVNPDFVRYMLDASRGFDAVVPETVQGLEPLHAIYSKNCLAPVLEQLRAGDLKVQSLFSTIHASYVRADEIERFDPARQMFVNMNTEREFRRAQAIARGIIES